MEPATPAPCVGFYAHLHQIHDMDDSEIWQKFYVVYIVVFSFEMNSVSSIDRSKDRTITQRRPQLRIKSRQTITWQGLV